MQVVAIVYFSATGHTQQMAEAVADGARSVNGIEAKLYRIVGTDIQDGRWRNDEILTELTSANAIVFGTPTYMGGVSGQFKSFIDACSGLWYQQAWKDKLAAGFTHSLGLSGDKLLTLSSLMIQAMQHGMIWVGPAVLAAGSTPDKINRLASYSGAMAQSNMDQPNIGPGDREAAVQLGKRVAHACLRWG